MPTRLQAILRQKCPVCLEGNAYRSGITMNEVCPVCGLRFEREQGYFLAAMYVAYGLAVPVLSAITVTIWLSTGKDVGASFVIAMVIFLPLSPIVYRYSKVVWMHLDQLIDPRPVSN